MLRTDLRRVGEIVRLTPGGVATEQRVTLAFDVRDGNGVRGTATISRVL